MKQSPNKLIPVIRQKMNSSLKIERRAESEQVEKFRQIMKNSFRIKKQMKALYVNVKQLKVEGAVTKPRVMDKITIKYNKLAFRSETVNDEDDVQADAETKCSTIIAKCKNFKQSQKMLEDEIIQKSRKTITYTRYQSTNKYMMNSCQSKPKQKSFNKIVESVTKNRIGIRPILYPSHGSLKNIRAQHYYILEAKENQPIIAHRSKTRIQIASLTKIMTFYTVYSIATQNDINISVQKMTITEDIVSISGTTAYLDVDQVYTIQQLLYGLMLPSGNDAALALAKWGGSILLKDSQNKAFLKEFMDRMNYQCSKLQMNDSKFGNPHGLPHKDSRTTCQDMARLCCNCLKIPKFTEIVSTKIYKYQVFCGRTKKYYTYHWQNTNKLLRRPGFIGIKTGITVTAGPCLASAYNFRDKTYIVIIAKSSKMSRRFKDTRKLLCFCLQKLFENQLSQQQKTTLKKLNRSNQDVDSDYSEEEQQFNFGVNHQKQLRKRIRIITQY